MLTLRLTLRDQQVSIHANGIESHQFSLLDLRQSREEWKDFLENPRVFGEKLFSALFRDASRAQVEFDALSKQPERTIVLVLESAELNGIAWEYAYNKAKEEYVVEECAFLRTLPENERPAHGRLKASYERVLLIFIPANPLVDMSGEPMRALDVDSEWIEVSRHITTSNAGFDLWKMLPATTEQLQTVMAQFRDGLIVHFSGHGATTKDGAMLLFERANGASNPLDAREFVSEIKDKAAITFLSACQSAVAEKTEFSNLARMLVKAGVPFALGMQFNLPDPFALDISGQFYNYLTRGHSVTEAARQARRAVKREHEFFVGMIALYAAHPDEAGALKWNGTGAQTLNTFRPADVSDLPSPASGLIGRQHELLHIGTKLLERRSPLTVTLHGAGGIGKTALLRHALLRFAPSFELTLSISLDPLPSLETVLGRIERFLGLPSPSANDTKEREALVQNALTSKRTLLGLDNFETLNYALINEGSDEEKTAKSLHAFFNSLAANGLTLCVTSREVTNLPGETIEDIQGLSNESGGRLFQENVVKQKNEIYIDKTQQVSEMVGGHPLALRLLAAAFDDLHGIPLDRYIEDLQSFLPKARDKWTEEDRHESLRASFDFTMNNLLKTEEGRELQVALSKLSVFSGYFVEITAAPILVGRMFEGEEDSRNMCESANKTFRALWERGLLERVSTLIGKDALHFNRLHPSLRVFAVDRSVGAESAKVQYRNSMSFLALRAEQKLRLDPVITRIALYALPDLLHVAESKNDEQSAALQYRVNNILQYFGHYDDALRILMKAHENYKQRSQQREVSVALHAMANIYVAQSRLDDALILYQQSLEIKNDLGDLQGKSSVLHNMAQIFIVRGLLDDALMHYKQSYEIDRELGEKQNGATLHEMAQIYVTRGDLDQAIKLYQESLKSFEEIRDLQGKAATLNNLAQIYVTRGDLDHAMKLYEESLEIDDLLGNKHGTAAVLTNLAQIYSTRGDVSSALKLYKRSFEIFDSVGDVQSQAVILNNVAQLHVMQGDLDKALRNYQESLAIKKRVGDKQGLSITLHNIAQTYAIQGDYKNAIELYRESLKVFDELGDLQNKSATLHEMANIFNTQGNPDKALQMYQESLGISKKLGELKTRSATLINMANIYVMRGDLDKAMKMYQESFDIDNSFGNQEGKSLALHSMAHVHMLKNDLDRAMELYRQSLEISVEIGNLKSKSATLHEMAYVYEIQGDSNEAMELYRQSLEISDEIRDLKGKSTTLHEIGRVYSKRGNIDEAMKWFHHSIEIKEKLNDIQGKGATLAMMGQILWKSNHFAEGLRDLAESYEIFSRIGAHPSTETVTGIIVDLRNKIGTATFDAIWKKAIGQPLPEWLTQQPKQ